jgi:hypothetical protein
VRSAELLAGVDPPIRAAQPFAVDHLCARAVQSQRRLFEQIDGLDIEIFSGRLVTDESPRARLDAQRQLRLGRAGSVPKFRHRLRRFLTAGVGGCLDQRGQRPHVQPAVILLCSLAASKLVRTGRGRCAGRRVSGRSNEHDALASFAGQLLAIFTTEPLHH